MIGLLHLLCAFHSSTSCTSCGFGKAVVPFYASSYYAVAPTPREESFAQLEDDKWPEWPKSMDRDVFEQVFRVDSSRSRLGFEIVSYLRFAKALRRAVRADFSPVYIIESPVYFVEHLLPMFFAVPGWLVLVRDGEYSEESLRVAREFNISRSAMLEVDLADFDLFYSNRTMLIACTNNWMRGHWLASSIQDKWDSHPLAVTLSHGIDEDPTYVGNLTLDPNQPPEPWRDLRSTYILRSLIQSRFGDGSQEALLEGLRSMLNIDRTKKTVLYISTVGDYEFLDASAPAGLGQQVWQGLYSLQQCYDYNVLVSLHPLLSLDRKGGLRVRLPQGEVEAREEEERWREGVDLEGIDEVIDLDLDLDWSVDWSHVSSETAQRVRPIDPWFDEEWHDVPCASDFSRDPFERSKKREHQWRGKKKGLVHALRQFGMLAAAAKMGAGDRKAHSKYTRLFGGGRGFGGGGGRGGRGGRDPNPFSLLPLVQLADVVVAPVSSGSKTALLQATDTPLVLLRARRSWDGVNTTDIAQRNEGVVLGADTAVVLDESMTADDLVTAVSGEADAETDAEAAAALGDAASAARIAAHRSRAHRRAEHRDYWFGRIDGYEELRTWFALLVTVAVPAPAPVEGEQEQEQAHADAKASSPTNASETLRFQSLAPLYRAYTNLLQPGSWGDSSRGSDNKTHNKAGGGKLAAATDHPLLRGLEMVNNDSND